MSARVIAFPQISHAQAVAEVIATMTEAGIKNVDEVWAEEWLCRMAESRRKRDAQIAAGMSREDRLNALIDELADGLAKAPSKSPPDPKKMAAARARLDFEAATDRIARLALLISDGVERRMMREE